MIYDDDDDDDWWLWLILLYYINDLLMKQIIVHIKNKVVFSVYIIYLNNKQ